jgi:membrane-bound serine protease (ClpP class)
VKIRLVTLLLLAVVSGGGLDLRSDESAATGTRKVYILPIRDEFNTQMVYLVRRGVKEAIEAKAELLVLDMDTNGGSVPALLEIIDSIGRFKGKTATYVNRKAFSAGALLSFATQTISMAPESVIGAAAPVMMAPGGTGVEAMPDTMEVKSASAISALMRVSAEKNGHNVEVVDAMVKKTKELKIDGKVLNEKGQILTLTNTEAEREYGDPPKPLLSSGTVENLDELLKKLGYTNAARVNIQPTGAEQVAMWINMISPLLLIIGIAGIYIEFKTPGFGLPGIVGIAAFALYFLGGYIAGLSGLEWIAVFVVGLALLALELFVFPGTTALGLIGTALMLVALVMAMVDVYPGMPALPTFKMLELPLRDLFIAFLGGAVIVVVLSRWLPKTSFYGKLVSQAASGVTTVAKLERQQMSRLGQVGVAISELRPGGKAQFGNEILDVISQGELIEKSQRVKIIGHSGTEAVVEGVG